MVSDHQSLNRGLDIRFEGGEGAGKTTLTLKIAQLLKKMGVPVIHIREPGSTPLADAVRGALLSDEDGETSARTKFLLFSAARSDAYERIVEPALQRGATIIGDRSWVSSMAYQVYAEGLNRDFATFISDFIIGKYQADITIIFDLPYEVGIARRLKTGDVNQIDLAGADFHKQVRHGFLTMAKEYGFPVIDAGATPDQVEAAAWDLIFPLIAERYPDIILARQEVK